MKKNNQGFMLVEALVMSMVVIGTLVFMYIQFENTSRGYDKSFKYNTVNGLYILNEIVFYLEEKTLLNDLKKSDKILTDGYIKINDKINTSLITKSNVKTVIIADEGLEKLKSVRTPNLSEKFQDFIKYLKVDNEEGKYRILVEFNDDTYASLKLRNVVSEVWVYNYKSEEPSFQVFNYVGKTQVFTVPTNGKYLLEVWGAQGGGSPTEVTYTAGGNNYTHTVGVGGLGGYSKGEINLTKGTSLNIYVGGKGSDQIYGGYNGGGNSDDEYGLGGGGGGATDIRINGTSLYNRVIVAGGGGGSSSNLHPITLSCSMSHSLHEDWYEKGGHGGGISSETGTSTWNGYGWRPANTAIVDCGYLIKSPTVANITESSILDLNDQRGYGDSNDYIYSGSFGSGSGSPTSYCGGGGGWFGGVGGYYTGGSGGSGWVYTEENYNTVVTASTQANVNEAIQDFANKWKLSNKYYLTNASTVSGVREGDGQAKISYSKPTNQKFTVPYDGIYRLNVLGPASGSKFVAGNILLKKDDELSIIVGKESEYNTEVYLGEEKIISISYEAYTSVFIDNTKFTAISYNKPNDLSGLNNGQVLIERW